MSEICRQAASRANLVSVVILWDLKHYTTANDGSPEQLHTVTDINREMFEMTLDAKNVFKKKSGLYSRWEVVKGMWQLWQWTRQYYTVGDITRSAMCSR